MKTISVIPLKRGIFKDNLMYFSMKETSPGDIVEIPVRNKKVLGLVIGSEDVAEVKSKIKNLNFNLKKITEIKEKSIFRKSFLETAILISEYFAQRRNDVVASMIPSAFKENYDKIANLKSKSINQEKKSSGVKSEKLLFQASLEDRISYYKTMIRESFAKKKSIFLVLPTEHDIKDYSQILSRGIENFIICLHGNLSEKKQVEEYKKIISSEHPLLILGTAPYLIVERSDIETIILEKESSGAYKTMNNLHLDLRVFVEIFSVKEGIKLILGDTFLRLETIYRKNKGDFGEISPLSFRTNFEGEIIIPEKEEGFRIFSGPTLKEIQNCVNKNRSVFVFSLRKGLATMTVCRDCGESVLCEKCNAPLVLYLSRDNTKRMFVCNRCKDEKETEILCKNCKSWNLISLGIGTDTVTEELKKSFPENKIFKLDKDSAKTPKQTEKIISDFSKNTGNILVGTEMAMFYLKEKVPLSVVASFDSLWSIPNYKMGERIIQIISSIISKTEKKLIIETKNSQDLVILAVKNENLLSFMRDELEDRKNMNYPPYRRFIKISYFGNKEQTAKAKNFLSDFFKDFNPEIFGGFIAKQKDKYATNALIKLSTHNWSLPEISTGSVIDQELLQKLNSLPNSFSVAVDPEDLL